MLDTTGAGPADIHRPVMLDRVVGILAPVISSGDVFVDATVGMGGHSAALLEVRPESRLVGIDRDAEAIGLARKRLGSGGRVELVRAGFDGVSGILRDLDVGAPAAFLLDLGVSSLQLDSDERGFAYSRETHLDMRMDSESPLTAAHVVNEYSPEELTRVFRQYGEERYARRIALAIARRREKHPIESTTELAGLVRDAVPAASRRSGGHPAKRVFQAIRIEVNDELGSLSRGLAAALSEVKVGGRVAVLSYHSLEDRIVKRAFVAGTRPSAPVGLPIVPPRCQPWLEAVTHGAERPTAEEVAQNPRAASARLRAVQKTRQPAGDKAVA